MRKPRILSRPLLVVSATVAAALLAVYACEKPVGTAPSTTAVAVVAVTPPSGTVVVGATMQFAATPEDPNGNPLSGRAVTWGSSAPGVASVDGSGMVRGVAVGAATITATSEGKSGTASVTVASVPVAAVAVTPPAVTIPQGQTVQLTATPQDASGNALGGRVITWASGNRAVATVSGSGLVTAVAPGAATITATSEGQSGTASVTVASVPVAAVAVTPPTVTIPQGQTVQLTATPQDASGNALGGRVITWASGNTAVATVSGSGLVRAVAPGAATITATSEGQSGTASVTVTAPPPPGTCLTSSATWQNTAFATQTGAFTAEFDATPNSAAMDGTVGLAAGVAASNTDLAVILRFNPSGQIDARNGGAYAAASVMAYSAGTSYHFRLVVDLATHSYSAYVTPAGGAEATLASGFAFRTEQSAVTALAQWALQAGTGTHTVCNFSLGGTTPAPVATVSVSPATANVLIGATVQLTATPKDANGTPLSGRVMTWASNNTGVATVSASGLVTGEGVGTATITATSEGKSGTAAITVIAPPPPGSDVVFIGAGDIGDCTRTSDDSTGALIARLNPDAVFSAGDNAYPDGTATEFATCFDPAWGRFKAKIHPVPGNHEYHQTGALPYFQYFGAAAGDPAKGYYSYDLGDWHIIALNGEISAGAGSAQETWLKADLAASTKTCTMAYIHRPRFSAGYHGSNSSMQAMWQDLYDAGAELWIAGHNHDYERFAPQTATGVADPARGLREFVVGTGGAGTEAWSTTPPIANEEAWANPVFGVLKLTLRAGGYDWEFIPIAGYTFTDSGSGTCH